MSKTWDNIIVKDEFSITGRGKVITVSLIDNKLTTDKWVNKTPFNIGDGFLYKGHPYEIIGIECAQNLFDNKLSESVGLRIKIKRYK